MVIVGIFASTRQHANRYDVCTSFVETAESIDNVNMSMCEKLKIGL